MLFDPHDNAGTRKGNSVSVLPLNVIEAQRSLVTGAGSLSQRVAPLGIRVMPFVFLGLFSVRQQTHLHRAEPSEAVLQCKRVGFRLKVAQLTCILPWEPGAWSPLELKQTARLPSF